MCGLQMQAATLLGKFAPGSVPGVFSHVCVSHLQSQDLPKLPLTSPALISVYLPYAFWALAIPAKNTWDVINARTSNDLDMPPPVQSIACELAYASSSRMHGLPRTIGSPASYRPLVVVIHIHAIAISFLITIGISVVETTYCAEPEQVLPAGQCVPPPDGFGCGVGCG